MRRTESSHPRAWGTCFGYQIRSATPFLCLREGQGQQLEVAVRRHHGPRGPLPLAMVWTEPPGQDASARLYDDRGQYWLWTSVGGWTLVEPEVPRVTLPVFADPVVSEELLWNVPVTLCLLHRGDLALHAGAVEVDGQALLFVAPGGAGKSTLTAAFVQAGYRLLSEDVSCLRLTPEPAIVPGPAMLRLSPDAIPHLTLPNAQVVRQVATRVTFALDQQRRGTCDPVPLRAVFLLQAATDRHVVGRVSMVDAIRRLWPMTFRLPGADWVTHCFAQLSELAKRIPVWSFARAPRLEDLPAAVEYLIAA